MSHKSIKCMLRSIDKLHEPFNLQHQVPFILGRSSLTKIRDLRCSKKQVVVHPDCKKFNVAVKQVGSNLSAINGKPINTGEIITAHHNDIIEVLVGLHKYKIEFDPLPSEETEELAEHLTEVEEMPRKTKSKAASPDKRKNPFEEFGYVDKKNKIKDSNGGWTDVNNGELLVYDHPDVKPSSKIACYDMDGTLIVTKSGRVFATDYNDWQIIFNEVNSKLKKLVKDGFKLVLFSNQAGIAAGKQTPQGIKGKFEKICESLDIPMQMYVAAGKTKYRKPYVGMWEYLQEQYNDGVKIDLDESVYVGDAAGRPQVGKKKKDFSCSDRLFAHNIGIKFQTPEEHFLGAAQQEFNLPEFDPKIGDSSTTLFDPSNTKLNKYPLEVVILVGYPGSGKSFISKTKFAEEGYIQVNRDTLGTWQKCVAVMEKSLDQGKSVVVDNTNPDVESRKRYIDAATAKKVPVRCFVFNASKDHARHNNKFREYTGEDHSKVNDMIFHSYKSKYQEPTTKENLKEIVRVNFIPNFKNESMEKIYKMYLLEK